MARPVSYIAPDLFEPSPVAWPFGEAVGEAFAGEDGDVISAAVTQLVAAGGRFPRPVAVAAALASAGVTAKRPAAMAAGDVRL